jgi:hypothetical protein
MRRVVDAYLAVFFVGCMTLVVGFTAARAVPPRWSLAGLLPFLLAALGGVLWLGRQDS